MRSPFLKLITTAAIVISVSSCSVASGRLTAGEYVDDTTITSKIKAQIFDNPKLKVMQINVETFQGVVQLSGFVDSEASRNTTENIARKVKGVKSVKDDIVVR